MCRIFIFIVCCKANFLIMGIFNKNINFSLKARSDIVDMCIMENSQREIGLFEMMTCDQKWKEENLTWCRFSQTLTNFLSNKCSYNNTLKNDMVKIGFLIIQILLTIKKFTTRYFCTTWLFFCSASFLKTFEKKRTNLTL